MYIIPVYNMTILPNAVTFLGKDAFQKSTGSQAEAGERVILLPTRTDDEQAHLAGSDFRGRWYQGEDSCSQACWYHRYSDV